MSPVSHKNHLGGEKSPYLRQHTDNPVDWYPWGEEAFERARREDKPVFLSIGYSSCHWCHVMERESFADEEAARLLNDAFVCVKVDREERPDLDQYYMAVCQAMTGSGGWPMTIVMTPDRKPFFAGTYIPKTRRWGRAGLADIVPRLGDAWRTRRGEILRAADAIVAAVAQAQLGIGTEDGRPVSAAGVPAPGEVRGTDAMRRPGDRAAAGASAKPAFGPGGLTPAVLDEAFRDLEADFDGRHGGFGSAPKFPSAHNLDFLFRYSRRTGRTAALAMAEKTLRGMRAGGIYDQLGHGFHRYSTDAGWLVPHFEKMLYDQAALARVYVEAFLATGSPEFIKTATETLDYVLRDMTSPEGAFYSAEDADSEGEEGRYYLWTEDEIRSALSETEVPLAMAAFGVRPEGNFSEPGGAGPDGRNVLHRKSPTDAEPPAAEDRAEGQNPAPQGQARMSTTSRGESPDVAAGIEAIEAVRAKLWRSREKRVRPFKDTKILADWNGLTIGALAAAGRVTGNERYVRAAQEACGFILERMSNGRGRLFHVYSDGQARIPAFLDDYAFLIDGLITLYEAAYDPLYLEEALALSDTAMSLFWDRDKGGFYSLAPGSELPLRTKETFDGAVPSGNSVMFMNLLRLGRMTGRPDLEEAAAGLANAFSRRVAARPRAHTAFLCGLDYALGPSQDVVVVGRPEDSLTKGLLAVTARTFLPNTTVLFKPATSRDGLRPREKGSGDDQPGNGRPGDRRGPGTGAPGRTAGIATAIERIAPLTASMNTVDDRPAAYVCSGGRCLKPVGSPEELERLLSGVPGS